MRKTFAPALAAALLLSATLPVDAEEGAPEEEQEATRPGTFNLVLENDRIANTDRHYTHGSYLSYVTGKGDVPDWIAGLDDTLPWLNGPVNRIGFVAGQTMFTPDDISSYELIEDDRPYAGYSYLGAKLYSEQLRADGPDGLQMWELNVGLVGHQSYADETQNLVHEVMDVQRPNGWDHQISNEPIGQLYYQRKWRFLTDLDELGHQAAVVPQVNGALGNAYVFGSAGASIVLGKNLRTNWGPARIAPGIRGTDFFDVGNAGTGEDWHWSIFFGGQVRSVARNIFLDGNTFANSHSVDKKLMIGEVQAGITVAYRSVQIALTQVFRTREFDEQDNPDAFGALTLSAKF